MPYHIKKVGTGFKVFKKGTNKALSKEPLTKSKAEAQMKAVEKKEGTHKMPDGTVMSGKTHSKNSKVVSKPKNKVKNKNKNKSSY
tara:strand:+ start:2151 stop:2405 length:255 start_codon:yes stop_codon:yes gene_type:complete